MARNNDVILCLSWSKLIIGTLVAILLVILLFIAGSHEGTISKKCKPANPCEVGKLHSDGTCTVAKKANNASCRSACYNSDAANGKCVHNTCVAKRSECKGYCSASGLSFSAFSECPRLPYDDSRLESPAQDFGACLAHSCLHVVFHGFTDELTEWLYQNASEVREDCFKLRNFDFSNFFPPGFAFARYKCAPFDFSDIILAEMESQMAAETVPGFSDFVATLNNPSTQTKFSAWASMAIANRYASLPAA